MVGSAALVGVKLFASNGARDGITAAGVSSSGSAGGGDSADGVEASSPARVLRGDVAELLAYAFWGCTR